MGLRGVCLSRARSRLTKRSASGATQGAPKKDALFFGEKNNAWFYQALFQEGRHDKRSLTSKSFRLEL